MVHVHCPRAFSMHKAPLTDELEYPMCFFSSFISPYTEESTLNPVDWRSLLMWKYIFSLSKTRKLYGGIRRYRAALSVGWEVRNILLCEEPLMDERVRFVFIIWDPEGFSGRRESCLEIEWSLRRSSKAFSWLLLEKMTWFGAWSQADFAWVMNQFNHLRVDE